MAKAVLRSLNADTVHMLPICRLPDGQTLETVDCPRVVGRSANMISGRLVMDIQHLKDQLIDDEENWRVIHVRLLVLAVLIVRLEGDWSLYAPGMPKVLDWPEIDERDLVGSLDALRARIGSLMELRQDDVEELNVALNKKARLSKDERGN